MNAVPGLENQENLNVDVPCLPSLCRGLYHRVAEKVGCDPSYVSRVARGERTSPKVSEALRTEIQRMWAKASEAQTARDGENGDAKPLKKKARAASASSRNGQES